VFSHKLPIILSEEKAETEMQKTFDQMLSEAGATRIVDTDTTPHTIIPCNVVLEPNTHQGITRVRVTARDKDFNLLWGVNMSEGLMPSDHPTPVAIYAALRTAIRSHLPDSAPAFEFTNDPYTAVDFCLQRLRETLNRCENVTVKVKKKSDTTTVRASRVATILFDTVRKLSEDLNEIGIVGGSREPEGDAVE
jgi:hypothetical protein